ncbi:MAG: hypothetical protein Q8P46_08550 [Hyphomicrobiales bacterium]|nr:hypothetical protein [Hyphomicrobiales bacterium]
MILRRGQARLAGRCGASVKSRNTATAQKNPAFGGPNRPTGFVAALARYPVSRVAARACPDEPTWPIESIPYNHEPL